MLIGQQLISSYGTKKAVSRMHAKNSKEETRNRSVSYTGSTDTIDIMLKLTSSGQVILRALLITPTKPVRHAERHKRLTPLERFKKQAGALGEL